MHDSRGTLITSNGYISYWSRLGNLDGFEYVDFNFFIANGELKNVKEVFVLIDVESLMEDADNGKRLNFFLSNLELTIEKNFQTKFILMPWFPSNLDVFTWEASHLEFSRLRSILTTKRNILDITLKYNNTVYFDLEFIIEKLGREKSESISGWCVASCRLTHEASRMIIDKIKNFQATDFAESKKVLLLDFDNTIWGGVIGEDEIDSIEVAPSGNGYKFYAFQNEILQLSQKGVMICGITKNNFDDVVEFFEKKDMPLKLSSFTCIYANWEPKHQNILKVSSELNLPTSSMIFIDDSEFERFQVQNNIPDLTILSPPTDFSQLIHWIARDIAPRFFPRKNITKEDEIRVESYKRRIKNTEMQSSQVESKIEILVNSHPTFTRISQMSEKTNQFNLRKSRISLEDLNQYALNPDNLIAAFDYADQFGSEGIVGYVMLKSERESIVIEAFVMSCRVIGRKLENFMFDFILKQAREKGAVEVKAKPLVTGRNQICLDYFESEGFFPLQSGDDWVRDVK
jgi:FkbH-like protein